MRTFNERMVDLIARKKELEEKFTQAVHAFENARELNGSRWNDELQELSEQKVMSFHALQALDIEVKTLMREVFGVTCGAVQKTLTEIGVDGLVSISITCRDSLEKT